MSICLVILNVLIVQLAMGSRQGCAWGKLNMTCLCWGVDTHSHFSATFTSCQSSCTRPETTISHTHTQIRPPPQQLVGHSCTSQSTYLYKDRWWIAIIYQVLPTLLVVFLCWELYPFLTKRRMKSRVWVQIFSLPFSQWMYFYYCLSCHLLEVTGSSNFLKFISLSLLDLNWFFVQRLPTK